jgi:hypothetical protein
MKQQMDDRGGAGEPLLALSGGELRTAGRVTGSNTGKWPGAPECRTTLTVVVIIIGSEATGGCTRTDNPPGAGFFLLVFTLANVRYRVAKTAEDGA